MKPGERLDGRFRIEARVGAGGMGVVYRARDERSDTTVAIKILDGSSPTRLERARREAHVLASIASPAIVAHVADGLTRDGRVYVVMEWVDGVTVADRLHAEGFTLGEAIALTGRVASALADAHREGVVHRDVKPSNVIIVDPAIKLIDFSVAWLVDAAVALTRTGGATGTPGYMAPEQARGDKQLTPAADVFGLACLFYECATGRPAFSGVLRTAVLAKVLYAEPTPLAVRCPEAPAAIIELLAAMLDKDPARRPTSAEVATFAAAFVAPEGPRRTARVHVDQVTIVTPSSSTWSVVLAAPGPPDDVVPLPPPEQLAAVAALAERAGGELAPLVNGVLAIRFAGDDADRATVCAQDLRDLLHGWFVVIASSPDVTTAIDRGIGELQAAATAAVFGRSR